MAERRRRRRLRRRARQPIELVERADAAISRRVEQPREGTAPSRARRRRPDAARDSRSHSSARSHRGCGAATAARAVARGARCTSVGRSADVRSRAPPPPTRSASRSSRCARRTRVPRALRGAGRRRQRTSARGAPFPHVMFVSAMTIGGIGRSGFTSVSKTGFTTPSLHVDGRDLGDAVAVIRARARSSRRPPR